jgi:YfiH family protein
MRTGMRQGIALHEFDRLRAHRRTVLAGCTGRSGGVSPPPYDALNLGLHVGDDVGAVLENRRLLARALGVELSSFVLPQQVHGREVRVVTRADRGRGAMALSDAVADADALITREAGVVLAVLLADCVPVILFDPLTPAVGVIHAGWGGTVNHVTRTAVEAMRSEFGSDPGTLVAGVGPSIGPASYEVGADVAERVQAEFPGAGIVLPHGDGEDRPRGDSEDRPRRDSKDRSHGDGKYLCDLWGANVAELTHAGVPRESIEVAELDTFQLPAQFFSHRRQRPTGRFLALAMLRT